MQAQNYKSASAFFGFCFTARGTKPNPPRPAEEGGFWGEVPALPGCVSQGETQEELLEHLKEAAIGWLEASQDEGELSAGSEVLEFAL